MSKLIFKNNQININNLFQSIWKGKWRVVLAIFISIILFGSYITFKPKQISTAVTRIVSVEIEELNKYLAINVYFQGKNIFDQFFPSPEKKIAFMITTRGKLLNSLVDELKQGKVFEEGIREFNLIDRSNYLNDKDHNLAIKKFIGNIFIRPPQNISGEKKGLPSRVNWEIQTSVIDQKKWIDILSFVNEIANENIQKNYLAQIEVLLASYEELKERKIVEIKNDINNLYEDDKVKTLNQLTFLREQAKIARVLGLAKNMSDTPKLFFKNFQDLNDNEKVLANLGASQPYYFNGYETIEKEIEIITSRNDLQKKAYIKGLLGMEQTLRSLEQDEEAKYIRSIYLSSPIYAKNFYSGKILSESTKFSDNDNTIFLIVISILFGLVTGILYVVVRNEFQSQKLYRK